MNKANKLPGKLMSVCAVFLKICAPSSKTSPVLLMIGSNTALAVSFTKSPALFNVLVATSFNLPITFPAPFANISAAKEKGTKTECSISFLIVLINKTVSVFIGFKRLALSILPICPTNPCFFSL